MIFSIMLDGSCVRINISPMYNIFFPSLLRTETSAGLLWIFWPHKILGISPLPGRLSVSQGFRCRPTSTTQRTKHKGQQSCIPSVQCRLIIRAADERTVTRTLKVSRERVSCFSASRKLCDSSRALHPSAYPTACWFVLRRKTLLRNAQFSGTACAHDVQTMVCDSECP